MRTTFHPRAILFGVLAAGICATAFVLGGALARFPNPAAVATGVTLDLTATIPAAYYVLVARPRGWSAAALAPVFACGLLLAALALPAEYRGALRVAEAVAVPAEVALLGWVARRTVRALRTAGAQGDTDPVGALHAGVRAALPAAAADVFASELAVLYYALGSWRARPHVPPGAQAFGTHRRSGHGGLVFALLMLTVVEGLAVHHLLAGWSTKVAWAVSALSAYGALWLVADYRATVLRPLAWDGAELWLRAGLRWRGRVPRGQIVRVSRGAAPKGRGARSLAFFAQPNVWVECAAPVALDGPYGLRREATCVGLFVDEPDRFVAALAGDGARA